MKFHFLLASLAASIFSGMACAQKAPPVPRTLNVQGEELPSACTPQSKSTLSAQLAAEAWVLVETLLCGEKSAASHKYIADHIGKTVQYAISSTGDKDKTKRTLANAELIDSLPSEGAEVMTTENEVIIKYMPNEACVRSRTIQLNKGKWKIVGLSEACD